MNFNRIVMKDVIDRTNRFYIEMSRKVLSEKEYDVLQKLLLEKMTFEELANSHGVTREYVRQIYESTYKKVKSVTELLGEIDYYKIKLQELKYSCKSGTAPIKKKKEDQTDSNKLLFNSHFPFSRRMYSFFEVMELHTIGQLAAIPLKDLHHFRGFKQQCKKELITFIEFENIEHLFEGFYAWKNQPMQ
jgi:hypothetical protein